MPPLEAGLQILAIVLGGLGALLGAIAAIRQARTSAQVAREDWERQEEDAQREAIDQVVSTLSADYRRLVEAQKTQQAAQDRLQDQIRTLTVENAELRERLDRLLHEHEILKAEHVRLKTQYGQLLAQYHRVATWAKKRGYRDEAPSGEEGESPT